MSRPAVAIVFALTVGQSTPAPIMLQLRVFHAAEEVTSETRITIHKAGEHNVTLNEAMGPDAPREFTVAPGIYDAQAIRERDGRVVNIRWAERLVVMPYPDEDGRHLEVVNFANGYGALQVRVPGGAPVPEMALYASGDRSQPAGMAVTGDRYALFVVPAGRYDIEINTGSKPVRHTGIDVPLDRTRLWLVP